MYFSISYQNTLHPTVKFVSNYLFKSFSFLYLKVSINYRMGSTGIIEIVLSLNLQLNISTFSAHHVTPNTLNELFHSALPREYDVSVPPTRCTVPGQSTLPDNPGDSRFWTVYRGLQIKVWNLPDNRRSMPFLIDSSFWQWNLKYFELIELSYC